MLKDCLTHWPTVVNAAAIQDSVSFVDSASQASRLTPEPFTLDPLYDCVSLMHELNVNVLVQSGWAFASIRQANEAHACSWGQLWI